MGLEVIVTFIESCQCMKQTANNLAIILLGVIVPILLLFQAYAGLSKIADDVARVDTSREVAASFQQLKSSLVSGNDYALFSMMSAERANLRTMTNKQIMKISIMQIGFAVISLGLMFIVLGINSGGAVGSGEAMGVRFDIRSGSTGVVVFLVGACMATAGGVMKNDYSTMPIPTYQVAEPRDTSGSAYQRLLGFYPQCLELGPGKSEECFMNAFRLVNKSVKR